MTPSLPTFDRVLPAIVYEQFAMELASQSVATPGSIILSQDDINLGSFQPPWFTVLIRPDLGVLLQGEETDLAGVYRLQLTFDSEAIAHFLARLDQATPGQSQQRWVYSAQNALAKTDQHSQGTAQAQVTFRLLNIISTDLSTYSTSCQPMVRTALDQRVEREKLLHQVTTQIRQSLELPDILKTAVDRIRQFLQVDRLLLGQFTGLDTGTITYESLSSGQIESVLGLTDDCWGDRQAACWQRLASGDLIAVADMQAHYGHSPCLGNLIQKLKIQAWLVVPILVQGDLWGVLIAHQCDRPRQWQPQEQEFLQHLSNHLSIAIYQSQLYAEVQAQKAILEQRVTERTQALREALISMQSAHRVKSDFLATMSHELRTPLTCVIGMSATLLRWSLGPLTDKQRHYLQTIHDSGTHLLELINSILDLSQVESGRARLNCSEFSLTQVSQQCLRLLQEQSRSHGIELRSQILISPSRDRFWGDYHRIQQILLNLLSNAIKFTPSTGTVILRVWCDDSGVIFQVEDNGIGIPEHLQPLLFQKFQQLDTSYGRTYAGVGLGLALTKQMVELHQGTIGVSSSEGKGTLFTVTLPSLPRESLGTETRSVDVPGTALAILEEAHSSPEGRLVLIDDDDENATLICEILTAAGYQVIWMVDAEIKRILELTPQGVIITQHLASCDAQEVMTRLRQYCSPAQVKLFLMTNLADLDRDNTTFKGYGAVDGWLALPIHPEQLLDQITAGLSQLGPREPLQGSEQIRARR
ncbi:ATP-binding protein [Candidatus Synechococcus calcipolaris G9]|uniref:histidine kinase n=1 Tax=Candidatus Synechococcus calcipolaris G9 TaxID=1497997 RepID=A0ABT6F0G8_9SYNE|nr:ATP-binding protein [Candidatus Synechococcus calcipolaris]MDG2991332.1 ATP-binding protein [Candidatus Synechococcus calcipolaris G9]